LNVGTAITEFPEISIALPLIQHVVRYVLGYSKGGFPWFIHTEEKLKFGGRFTGTVSTNIFNLAGYV
jgi:hypothetical protein